MSKETWKKNGSICPKCNYHGRLPVRERIAATADEGTFEEMFREVSYSDHLRFHDASGDYRSKIEATIAKTGEKESVVTGRCTIEGHPVVLGVMDFSFMGGSLGTGTGERIARACETAVAERRPVIIFSASGGARMHEGILSLLQMAKTSAAIAKVKEAVSIPVIGNGDVTGPEKARALMEETGCDGVMIGRGARGNPWIFSRVETYLKSGVLLPGPTLAEVREMILTHARAQVAFRGEKSAMREMRKHVAWYTAGMPHGAQIRREANGVETMEELCALMDRLGT
jgi:hypothetical protein